MPLGGNLERRTYNREPASEAKAIFGPDQIDSMAALDRVCALESWSPELLEAVSNEIGNKLVEAKTYSKAAYDFTLESRLCDFARRVVYSDIHEKADILDIVVSLEDRREVRNAKSEAIPGLESERSLTPAQVEHVYQCLTKDEFVVMLPSTHPDHEAARDFFSKRVHEFETFLAGKLVSDANKARRKSCLGLLGSDSNLSVGTLQIVKELFLQDTGSELAPEALRVLRVQEELSQESIEAVFPYLLEVSYDRRSPAVACVAHNYTPQVEASLRKHLTERWEDFLSDYLPSEGGPAALFELLDGLKEHDVPVDKAAAIEIDCRLLLSNMASTMRVLETNPYLQRFRPVAEFRRKVLGINNPNFNFHVDSYIMRLLEGREISDLSDQEVAEIKGWAGKVEKLSHKEALLNNKYFIDLGVEIKVWGTEREAADPSYEERTSFKRQALERLTPIKLGEYSEHYPGPYNYPASLIFLLLELQREELIPLKGLKRERHPLHITLGGLEADRHLYALAYGLMGTGWASSAQRIKDGLGGDPMAHWKSGKDKGIHSRVAGELVGEFKVAQELRPFCVREDNPRGANKTLVALFYLGSALKSLQLSKKDEELSKVGWAQEVVAIFEGFEREVLSIFRHYGLPIPDHELSDNEYFAVAEAMEEVDGKPSPFSQELAKATLATKTKAARVVGRYLRNLGE